MTYCNNNEYGCDNKIPDEFEGDLCATCEADEKREREYYERLYRASKSVLSKDEILDAYSDPTDYQKRARMEREL